MAALDFPASPTIGQIYSANGSSWEWDGEKWNAVGDSGGPSVDSVSSSSTITAAATNSQYNVTALAVNTTIAAPSGTPVDGHRLIYRIKDNGTARTISWNAIFRVVGTTLPTSTSSNKVMYIGTIYNAQDTRWDVISVTVEI